MLSMFPTRNKLTEHRHLPRKSRLPASLNTKAIVHGSASNDCMPLSPSPFRQPPIWQPPALSFQVLRKNKESPSKATSSRK